MNWNVGNFHAITFDEVFSFSLLLLEILHQISSGVARGAASRRIALQLIMLGIRAFRRRLEAGKGSA